MTKQIIKNNNIKNYTCQYIVIKGTQNNKKIFLIFNFQHRIDVGTKKKKKKKRMGPSLLIILQPGTGQVAQWQLLSVQPGET